MAFNPLVWISVRCNTCPRAYTQFFVLCISSLFYYEEIKGAYLVVSNGYGRYPLLFAAFGLGFAVVVTFAILTHIRLLFASPGFVLPGQKLPESVTAWNECDVCHAQRPLGAHHCRVCDKCVVGRDHHCPWINNCVGHCNQWLFMMFACYVLLGSIGLSVFLLEYLLTQTCSTCHFPETRTSAAISFVIVLFCLVTSLGIQVSQASALGGRARELSRENLAKMSDSEQGEVPDSEKKDLSEAEAKQKSEYDGRVLMIRAWKTIINDLRGDTKGLDAFIAVTPFWHRPRSPYDGPVLLI